MVNEWRILDHAFDNNTNVWDVVHSRANLKYYAMTVGPKQGILRWSLTLYRAIEDHFLQWRPFINEIQEKKKIEDGKESVKHKFFKCCFGKCIWKWVRLNCGLPQAGVMDLEDIIKDTMHEMVELQPFQEIAF